MHITQRTNGIWYYQRRIPLASQPFFNHKTSIKTSLRTSSKSEAIRKARQLSVEHDALFAKHSALASSDTHQHSRVAQNFSQKLSKRYLINKLADYSSRVLIASQQLYGDGLSTKTQRDAHYTGLEELQDELRESVDSLLDETATSYELRQHRPWRLLEGAFSTEHLATFETLSTQEQDKVFIQFVANSNKYLTQLIRSFTSPLQAEAIPELPLDYLAEDEKAGELEESPQGKMLSECIELYLQARKRDEIHEKTYNRHVARMELMQRILGDVDIKTLNREAALSFQQTVLSLPKNINKDARYRDKSLSEILALNPEPMSTSTANDTFTDVNRFFEWCVLNEFIDRNPFKQLKVKQKKRSHEQREVFTSDDLKVLFSQDIHRVSRPKHPHYYWLPVLALYTGARLNELCQLYKADIEQSDIGTWSITFTDSRPDQKLKNQSSLRTIPLHSRLIELGFIEYLYSVEHERVFPELKLQRDGYQTAASKWFARYRDKVLPNAGAEGKAFHSFRHNVADHLKQKGLPKSPVAAILGHAENNETFGRYGKGYSMDVLTPVIEQLSFDVKITPWDKLS
ncbi:tyrosine-type recombinase/integrase [Photobacterium ganghwense]|uniref:tyrosine-type recombinase/integrase n=1 Tax=Photobacterium ganghwense TaxID=320778 RepID=UPI0040563E4F